MKVPDKPVAKTVYVLFANHFEPNLRFGREADPMIFGLEWQVTVRLLDGADRVDFDYEIFWKTANRRLRAVFPTQAGSDSGWYSIPGGWLERPRYDQTETHLWSPNGDWPVLYFVAARGADADAPGWALANYGAPAARIEDGRILASLLRSPAFGHCLERYAQNYPMPTGNLRDAGWHHLSLSLLPHAGKRDMPSLCRRAAALGVRPDLKGPNAFRINRPSPNPNHIFRHFISTFRQENAWHLDLGRYCMPYI